MRYGRFSLSGPHPGSTLMKNLVQMFIVKVLGLRCLFVEGIPSYSFQDLSTVSGDPRSPGSTVVSKSLRPYDTNGDVSVGE